MNNWRKYLQGAAFRVAKNAVSTLTSEVMSRVTTLIVNVMVLRYLGQHAFGQVALGLTLFHSFAIFSLLGLSTLTTREVTRNRGQSDAYLLNGSALVIIASLVCMGLMYLLALIAGYSQETTLVLIILSLGLAPLSLAKVSEAVIRAWEKMHLIAYANFPANLAKLAVCYVGLANGYGVLFVCLTLVLFHVLVYLFQLGMLMVAVGVPRLKALDRSFAQKIARDGLPFIGLFGVLALWPAISSVLLSLFFDESEVGIFNAGIQLIAPVTLLWRNLMSSLFPLLCRRYDSSANDLGHMAQRILEFTLALAIPASVGLFLLAEPVVVMLFTEESVVVLQIVAWTIICNAMTQTLGHVLLASHREHTTLRIVTVTLLASVLVGVPLIAKFGAVGAAVTVLVGRIVDLWQHCEEVGKLLAARIPYEKLVWRAIAASSIMAIVLIELDVPGIVLPIVLGVSVYAAAFILLMSEIRQRIWLTLSRSRSA